MIINPRDLTRMDETGFSLNDYAEQRICEMVFRSPVAEQSKGYSPEWDIKLENGKTVEVKFTSSSDIFIETTYGSGAPSGLQLSEADYYLVVHQGYWAAQGGTIGKVKVYRTEDLRAIESACVRKKFYNDGSRGSGSEGFLIGKNNEYIEEWIGNLRWDNGYDLSSWAQGKRVNKI